MTEEDRELWLDSTLDIDIVDPELERSREYRIAKFIHENRGNDVFNLFWKQFAIVTGARRKLPIYENLIKELILKGKKEITVYEYLDLYGGRYDAVVNYFQKLKEAGVIQSRVPYRNKQFARPRALYSINMDILEKYYLIYQLLSDGSDI